ncbi:hypothetical protein MNBD_ALPHA04-332 [hydrothermal vent metagenome]|uniref:Uncharacterized protein n=1 Tax=hydrothermal vent metagenome TaxID=652676 RepID=A0A3B0RM98_9ZZZZ
MSNWQNQFSADAGLFPHLLDLPSDQILLSHLCEEEYRKASFLDQRIFTPQLKRQLVPWSKVSQISLPERPSPQYIFHIGHVGSTLISRLLGEIDMVLALREPQILRTLAEISRMDGAPQSPWSLETYHARFSEIIRWLSRSYDREQRVMIKASSFVSEIASQLLSDNQDALFLYAPLERYLPTILAGEASVQETHALAGDRLLRLSKHLGEAPANLWDLSLAQRATLSWLCEMVSLRDAEKKSISANILWMDFEDFLIAPATQLRKAADHFHHTLSEEAATKLISGPIMSSYSKAPEHDYSPDLRQELLKEASQNHADDIGAAMLWADKLAEKYPSIANVMTLAEKRA